MHNQHLVIGAGVAGLSCARELSRAGHHVLVVDKARGVGGRCATTRVDDQPVDFGPVFLHGSDEDFVQELRSIPSIRLLEDWPRRRRGSGKPCQHEAFLPTEKRFAIAEGVSAFAKHLASGLDLRLDARVTQIALDGARLAITLDGGERLEAASVVIAMPVEQALALIWPLAQNSEELEAVAMLLDMVPSVPCLTLMAGYPLEAPEPAWDVFYPEKSPALMLVCNDSAKRTEPKHRVLVIQGSPHWSRRYLDQAPEAWSSELLSETARQVGDWVSEPSWTRTHRWRYSRVDLGNELTGPVRVRLPGGASLGLAGDVFAPGGGMEAAFHAGRTLAGRLLHEDENNE